MCHQEAVAFGRRPCTRARGRRVVLGQRMRRTTAFSCHVTAVRTGAPTWPTTSLFATCSARTATAPTRCRGSQRQGEGSLAGAAHARGSCKNCHNEDHPTLPVRGILRDGWGLDTVRSSARSWATGRPGTSCARRAGEGRPRAGRRCANERLRAARSGPGGERRAACASRSTGAGPPSDTDTEPRGRDEQPVRVLHGKAVW